MFPLNRHERLRRNLSAYADGELPSRDTARVEGHLATCEACRAILAGLRLASEALGGLPVADTPRSFALTPEMAGAPSAAPVPRSTPAYANGLRFAAAGLAMALAVVMVADRSDFGGSGQSSDEAQVAGLDERTSQTFGATEESAAEYDAAGDQTDAAFGAPQATGGPARVTQAPGGATPPAGGIGFGGGIGPDVTSAPIATQVPGEPLASAGGLELDVTPGSLPEHDALANDSDAKITENLAAAESDAETAQDGDEQAPVASDGDNSAFTIVEIVLVVLLGAALCGLALAWISQRRSPL